MLARIRTTLRHFSTTEILWLSLIFIVVYAWFFAIVFPVARCYERLAHAGVHTSGHIVATEPKNHMSIRYDYTVNGANYEGVMSDFFLEPPRLDQIRIGQAVPVTYWPDRPWISVPVDPYKVYEYWWNLLVAVPLSFAFVAAIAMGLRFRRDAVTAFLTKRWS